MKILVLSDTHRQDDTMKEAIDKEKPIDILIHLGDAEGSEAKVAEWVNGDCDVHMVLGNNDFFAHLDKEQELRIGKYKALITHGNYYGVSLGVENIKDEAKARGLDMVMFGHTHKPYNEVRDGVWLLNPGSISYPRQSKREYTYMVLTVDKAGEVSVELKKLD